MWYIAIVIFLFHGLLFVIDEIYYHRNRGLGRWERIGHPADTITVLVCYLVVLCLPPTHQNLVIYTLLAIFSCLFVTKDEFVHAKLCTLGEMWLHSVLFLLHPILFTILAFYWVASSTEIHSNLQLLQDDSLRVFKLFFWGEVVLTFLNFLYQTIYWNFLWKDQPTK